MYIDYRFKSSTRLDKYLSADIRTIIPDLSSKQSWLMVEARPGQAGYLGPGLLQPQSPSASYVTEVCNSYVTGTTLGIVTEPHPNSRGKLSPQIWHRNVKQMLQEE